MTSKNLYHYSGMCGKSCRVTGLNVALIGLWDFSLIMLLLHSYCISSDNKWACLTSLYVFLVNMTKMQSDKINIKCHGPSFHSLCYRLILSRVGR